MKRNSNTWTIIRKEFARFFGDRALFFTAVIMPGLLIYLIYTLMGSFMGKEFEQEAAEEAVTEQVSQLSPAEEALLDSLLTVRYASMEESSPEEDKEELGKVLGNLIPMLIIMLLYSGCMAVAPSSIAGEKERGTIATLLVTPMKRSELAIGKIVSLSCFALLSGLSSFLGIILSLPKMLQADTTGLPDNLYGWNDFLLIFLLIMSTVLIIISCISILSAWAKDVKTAGTMVLPLMLFIMFAGLTPMMGGAPDNVAYFLIPVYNSAQAMSSIFAFDIHPLQVIVTVVANVVYTGLAVFALTKMFNSEKVMFSK